MVEQDGFAEMPRVKVQVQACVPCACLKECWPASWVHGTAVPGPSPRCTFWPGIRVGEPFWCTCVASAEEVHRLLLEGSTDVSAFQKIMDTGEKHRRSFHIDLAVAKALVNSAKGKAKPKAKSGPGSQAQ